MKIRTRRLGKHRRGCAAVRHAEYAGGWRRWDSAWGVIVDRATWFKHGRSGTTGPWVVWCCNDIDCPAKIAVRTDDLLALLPKF